MEKTQSRRPAVTPWRVGPISLRRIGSEESGFHEYIGNLDCPVLLMDVVVKIFPDGEKGPYMTIEPRRDMVNKRGR